MLITAFVAKGAFVAAGKVVAGAFVQCARGFRRLCVCGLGRLFVRVSFGRIALCLVLFLVQVFAFVVSTSPFLEVSADFTLVGVVPFLMAFAAFVGVRVSVGVRLNGRS